MNEPTVKDLTQRVDRLERENRRVKRAASLGLVVIAALVLMGQAVPKGAMVVEAEKFVVLDTGGKMRAGLGTLPNGAVVLGFWDKDGKARVRLGVEPDGSSSLGLYDKNERFRVVLNAGADESAGLMLNDKDGNGRAALGVLPDGSAVLIPR